VADFSSGLPSFELSFELTCLNSSISTIMHPARSEESPVNDSVLREHGHELVTCLRRRGPWLRQRARGGLRVSDSLLCHQTGPERGRVNGRIEEGKGRRETPYCVSGTVVQELGTRIESPVVVVELDGERRRVVLVLLEYRLSLPGQVVDHRRQLLSHDLAWLGSSL